MQRKILSFTFSLAPMICFAQDKDSPAYKTGYAIGQVVGYLLIAGLLIWGISKLFRKK